MIYCDASLLVAALTPERHSEMATSWLERRSPGELSVSHWTEVEIASALAMKVRRGTLNTIEQDRVQRAWVELARGCQVFEVDAVDFRRAASLVQAGPGGLRAGDALHVAIAAQRDLTIATLDHDMEMGARAVGVRVMALVSYS